MANMEKRFKGIIFALSLFISSFLGAIFFLFPFLFLILVSPTLYRKVIDGIVYYWFLFVVALVESFLCIDVIVDFAPGIKLDPKDRYLIIMNHYSRVDWLFFWSCLYRIDFMLTHKIILKAPLKKIPGAGWAMQMANFIFINRKWETDQIILASSIDYFAKLDYPYKILLFPEGTDFSPSNIRKSREYAIKNDLPVYRHLLQPRTTGFVYLVEKMRQAGHLDTVLDVTVSYYDRAPEPDEGQQSRTPQDCRPTPYHHSTHATASTALPSSANVGDPFASPCTEGGILRGEYPDVVRFSCRTYDATRDLPVGSEALAAWCRALWSDKDSLLQADCPGSAAEGDPGGRGRSSPKRCAGRRTYTSFPITHSAHRLYGPILIIGAWYAFVGFVGAAALLPTLARTPVIAYLALACGVLAFARYGDDEGRGLDRIAIKLAGTRVIPGTTGTLVNGKGVRVKATKKDVNNNITLNSREKRA